MLRGLFDAGYKELKRVEKIANKIEAVASTYSSLSDDELKAKTPYFKNCLKNGSTLDDIIVDAFATVREAAKRVIGLYPFKVQVIGALALHGGNIAEMKTGEGKTLTATMTAYLNALSGDGVHIVTVNEYLASRDAEEMGQIFKWLGLTVGLNLHDYELDRKKEQYQCDIMYTTCSEIGFDYLRDNMATNKSELVQRTLNYAIIDEADSILIDEAKTPLIISGPSGAGSSAYLKADIIIKRLVENVDYKIDRKDRYVALTEEGIRKVEDYFKLTELYANHNLQILHYVENSLKANYIFKKDVDYVVEEDQIVLVDQFTGRLMYGRQLTDGLHQAIEAKERVEVNEKAMTVATITIQNFFRMYKKLAGMTGTAKTEENEFIETYNMYVVEVPTNRPMIRQDLPLLFFLSEEEKFEAIAKEVKRRNEIGQPVLIGTTSIEKSIYLSDIFKKQNIKHTVLNAYHYAEEAKIVAEAGNIGAVTIATNMAGRGTDIKLAKGVSELGGLFVIGTEIHESKRIDNQLSGRAGRQGDPGLSRFYVSLTDEIFLDHVDDNIKQRVNPDYFDNPDGVESDYYSKIFLHAQTKVASINYIVRKRVLEYDEVMRRQRELIYNVRMKLLTADNPLEMIRKFFMSYIQRILKRKGRNINYPEVENNLSRLGIEVDGNIVLDYDSYVDNLMTRLFESGLSEIARQIAVSIMTSAWMHHIDTMETMRQAMRFKRYAQEDDLAEYKRIGNEIFDEMLMTIEINIIKNINSLK